MPPPDLPLPAFQIHRVVPKPKRHLYIYSFSKLPCLVKGRGSCFESASPEEKLCYSAVSQTKSLVSSASTCAGLPTVIMAAWAQRVELETGVAQCWAHTNLLPHRRNKLAGIKIATN